MTVVQGQQVAPWLPEVVGGRFEGALAGGADPSDTDGYTDHPPRMGFFTDTSVCIGCKACEVACKEWNHIPEDGLTFTGMSYDNSVGLGADTWRHGDGRAWKCTLCYDRISDGLEPACAKACPTDSIQFGPLEELRERATRRLDQLHEAGVTDARLYGHDPGDGVGGDGAFFLLFDEPEVYGLPPDPVVTTRDLPSMWRHAAAAAGTLAAAAVVSFAAAVLGEATVSESDVTREGVRGKRPDRDATTGVNVGRRWQGRRRAEQPVVPPAQFTSYYGKPVINMPVWESPDIPGYLFLGGLAGGSSLLAAGSQLIGHRVVSRAAKTGAFAAGAVSVAALVHDLGRPARFLHMLRVLKVTSPMSVGSWLLGGYVPAAGVAALTALTGRLPRVGAAATAGSAMLGPAVAAYTAALISNTAVPAWHDGYPEMPFVFTGSGAMAAGGLGLLVAPPRESAPARNLALLGAAMETAALQHMEHRIGMVAEPYSEGRGGRYMKAGKALSAIGVAAAALSHRSRLAAVLSGATLIVASAASRWGIYHAGMASAGDPKYTVVPQRQRVAERAAADGAAAVQSVETGR